MRVEASTFDSLGLGTMFATGLRRNTNTIPSFIILGGICGNGFECSLTIWTTIGRQFRLLVDAQRRLTNMGYIGRVFYGYIFDVMERINK